MDGIRKILVLIFALCSAYFGVLAFMQKDEPKKEEDSFACANWSIGEFVKARKSDKLIFFKLNTFQNPVKTPEANEILRKYYTLLELNPVAFPADYNALKKIFNNAGASGNLNLGIISPRGYPIFLAENFSEDSNSNLSEKMMLLGAVNIFKKQADTFRSNTRAAMFFENELANFPIQLRSLFTARNIGEIMRLRMLFANLDAKNSAAIFSENARLIARIAKSEHSFLSEEASLLAYAKMKIEFARAKTFTDKMLYVRAMSEFAFLEGQNTFKQDFLLAAKSLLNAQSKDSLFYTKFNDVEYALTSENALALSILARAYALSGDEIFAKSAQNLSAKMCDITKSKATIPAILASSEGELESEADAIGAVLLARSFLDAFFAFADEDYLKNSEYFFHKFDTLYSDEESVGWFANSNVSVFAQSFRYRDKFDGDMPSATGEAAQMLADILAIKQVYPNRLISVLSPLANTVGIRNLDRASLKLATLENPMRKHFLSEKVKGEEANLVAVFSFENSSN